MTHVDQLPSIPTHAEVEADPGVLRTFNERIVAAFRARGGVVGGPFAGADVLLLTTTGARTGATRVVPLEYFRLDGRLVVLGTYGGAPRHPAWVYNLRAHPNVTVEVGERSFHAVADEMTGADADRTYEAIAARSARVARYPTPRRRIPVFALHERESG